MIHRTGKRAEHKSKKYKTQDEMIHAENEDENKTAAEEKVIEKKEGGAVYSEQYVGRMK